MTKIRFYITLQYYFRQRLSLISKTLKYWDIYMYV